MTFAFETTEESLRDLSFLSEWKLEILGLEARGLRIADSANPLEWVRYSNGTVRQVWATEPIPGVVPLSALMMVLA